MNDQQIYALMAKTPNIRAVQIADAFDVELVNASNALRSLVEIGDVVQHSGIGPNQRPAQMYNLSPEFKKSREGMALLASVATQPTAAPTPVPAAPAPTTTPVFANEVELPSGGTKVSRGVEYVVAKGSATDDELRAVMSIEKPAAPAAYLAAAIKAGKVHKDGGVWKPGAPSEPAQIILPPATQAPVKTAAPEAIPAPATAPSYRCALWCDGIVELQCDGEKLAALPLEAVHAMVAFLTNLGQVE